MSLSRLEEVQAVLLQLEPLLKRMEVERLEILKRMAHGHRAMVLAGICWAALCVCLLVSGAGGLGSLLLPLIGFAVSMFVIQAMYIGGRKRAYIQHYKSKVLTKVTRIVQSEMSYLPNQGISQSLFKSSGIHRSRIDRYTSEDLFVGNVGETKVHFSEVKSEKKETTTDAKGHTHTSWETTFDGIFFMADFHKEFDTWVTVMPDFAERSFGWFGKKLQNLGGSIVRLENPEFEKAFVVRGGDQVAARYILTPDMQERLLQLRKYHGDSVKLVFKDSSVILTFDSSLDWFEPDLLKPSNDSRQIASFVMELQSCCGIVEMLNLNTRIWTKA